MEVRVRYARQLEGDLLGGDATCAANVLVEPVGLWRAGEGVYPVAGKWDGNGQMVGTGGEWVRGC